MDDAETRIRRRPRQSRSRHTVEAVLAAVPLVIQRHGPASLTTNRIAEVAGVSIGSLYQYFPDKQSIVAALLERHAADAELHRLACASTAPGTDHFRQALRSSFERAASWHHQEEGQRILAVLPSLVEGVVHGVVASPLASGKAKDEAMRATIAYLSIHRDLA